MPAHPTLSTLADTAVASNGTCHCHPELHTFPVYNISISVYFLKLIDFDFKDLKETIEKQPAYIPTQGIDITKQAIGDAGIFRIWDCAGHVEYHVSHSMFLGAENSVFIIVYNLTKEQHEKDVSICVSVCFK